MLVVGIVLELLVVVGIDFLELKVPAEVLEKRRKIAANLIATVLILVGVAIENLAGSRSDGVIAQMRARRSLTGAQIAAIANKLRPFAGESIDILSYRDDVEAWWIANKIEIALGAFGDEAGWRVHFATVTEYNRALDGMVVETTDHADSKDLSAAKALVSALQSEGVVVGGPISIMKNLHADAFGDVTNEPIHLTVGNRPIGPTVGP